MRADDVPESVNALKPSMGIEVIKISVFSDSQTVEDGADTSTCIHIALPTSRFSRA